MNISYYNIPVVREIFSSSLVFESQGEQNRLDQNTTITIEEPKRVADIFKKLGLDYEEDSLLNLKKLVSIETTYTYSGGEGEVFVKETPKGSRIVLKTFGSTLSRNDQFYGDKSVRGVDIFYMWEIAEKVFRANGFDLAKMYAMYGNTGMIEHVPGVDLYEIYKKYISSYPDSDLFLDVGKLLDAMNTLFIDAVTRRYRQFETSTGGHNDALWIKSRHYPGEYYLQLDFAPFQSDMTRLNNWIFSTNLQMDELISRLRYLSHLPKFISRRILMKSIKCIDPFLLVYTENSNRK